jgi:predicted CXXCH cytochrome family protein
LPAVFAFLLLISIPWTGARAEGLSEADQKCLGCHGFAGMEKSLAGGEKLDLHVAADPFEKSVHAGMGCASCHADVNPDNHPPSSKTISTAREYSVTSAEVCRGCHTDKFDEWQKSIHATLARQGNPAAPVCTNCHRPHEVIKGALDKVEASPCQGCHSAIFTAYLGSMHGRARIQGNVGAPQCSNCHGAHDVTAASLGEGPKTACLGCHSNAPEAHEAWLPNAGRHLDTISCPACHAPKAQRRVDLRLYDSASQTRVSEQQGVPLLESARSNGTGLDAMALWTLLKTFNRPGMEGKTVLRGRLEVRTGPEAHQLMGKSQAISDCKTCHRAGSDAFGTVTVSVARADGRPVRYRAEQDVLSSVVSIDSVSGFYAIGATRIGLLDIALALALMGGLGVPIAHMSWGWLLKRYLAKQATKSA